MKNHFKDTKIDDKEVYIDYASRPVRKDILFYEPGSDYVWSDQYEEISKGDNIIKGKVYIDDEPAEGLEIALIIASGRQTPRATVNSQGDFSISVPEGEYYLNGIIIYNLSDRIQDKIFINKIAKDEQGYFDHPIQSSDEIMKIFQELSDKYGSEEASKRITDQLQDVVVSRDQFKFVVTDKGYTLPDFHYRKPVKIISPLHVSSVSLEKLQFIWEAVPNAHTYKISVEHIVKKGSTTSYYPVLTCDNIEKNFIKYDDALQKTKEQDYLWGGVNPLEPNNLYGWRIVAIDNKGKIITSSDEDISDLSMFRVE